MACPKRCRCPLQNALTKPPYAATWKTDWVPDQDEPIRLMARVRNADGIYYMTETVEDLQLTRYSPTP